MLVDGMFFKISFGKQVDFFLLLVFLKIFNTGGVKNMVGELKIANILY